jgi:hypothetical protein
MSAEVYTERRLRIFIATHFDAEGDPSSPACSAEFKAAGKFSIGRTKFVGGSNICNNCNGKS